MLFRSDRWSTERRGRQLDSQVAGGDIHSRVTKSTAHLLGPLHLRYLSLSHVCKLFLAVFPTLAMGIECGETCVTSLLTFLIGPSFSDELNRRLVAFVAFGFMHYNSTLRIE